MCEILYENVDSGFWDFNNSKSKNNKYGNYIFSKFRYSNFRYIEKNSSEVSDDELSAVKTLLRLGEKNKYKNIAKIVNMVGINTLKFLFDKVKSNETPELIKFEELILKNSEEEIKKACYYSPNALAEIIKKFPKENEIIKGSYIYDDYSNIVSSSAFRRLQDKAQVYSLEEHDFVRSRLTHSNEVAANCELIASGINFYNKFTEIDIKNAMLICRCAGLLHDIGNPPFGHYGEDLIKSFFIDVFKENKKFIHNDILKSDFIKFDGNAQAFRIVTKLQYFGKKNSLNLPACVLGAIIKYPFCSTFDFGKDKFGYFISEMEDVAWLNTLGVFQENVRNPFAIILEAADDISYITADLEDAIHKGIVNFSSFKRLKYTKNNKNKKTKNNENNKIMEFYNKLKSNYDENINDYLKINFKSDYMPKRSEIILPSYVEQRIFEKSMRPLIADLRQELIVECSKQINMDYDEIFKDGAVIKSKNNYYELVKKITSYNELIEELKNIVGTVYASNEVSKAEVSGSVIINKILSEYFKALKSISKIDYKKREFKYDDKKNIAQNKYFKKILTYVSNDFIDNFFVEMERVKSNNFYYEEYKSNFFKNEDKENETDEKKLKKIYEKDMEHFYLMHLLIDFVSGMTDSFSNEIYHVLTNN